MQQEPPADPETAYVAWEEVVISPDKGRREVHYLLKDAAGGAHVAVVGKERSARHMYYVATGRFAVHAAAVAESSPFPAAVAEGPVYRWKSRREVVDWLSTLVSGASAKSSSLTDVSDDFLDNDDDDADFADVDSSKPYSSANVGHYLKDFMWVGPSWDCKKRRKHYQSFCRMGTKISVHDFVYILSEEKRRFVAYVEDLYEDMRANKLVVVRWFHKPDEVGIALPSDLHDREIFFSLCLQDFSVECIDGLAAVLSAQHFEKFQKETKKVGWYPYLCRSQIDNDDVKPFDVTHLLGYWSQEIVCSMSAPSLKLRLKIRNVEPGSVGLKRKHDSENDDISMKCARNSDNRLKRNEVHHALPRNLNNSRHKWQINPGCYIEVLSQDSGIRGCWFKCLVLKVSGDKVRVRYLDLQNADETGNLEEWLLMTRFADPDNLGIRLHRRPMLRPHLLQRPKVPSSFDVGAVVDAWWHGGWWEGIVISRDSDGNIHVYFPGEKQVSVFVQLELRQSLDWAGNTWKLLTDRKDVALSVLKSGEAVRNLPVKEPKLATPSTELHCTEEQETRHDGTNAEEGSAKSSGAGVSQINRAECTVDLTKELGSDSLKWTSRRQRRRYTASKRFSDTSSGSSQEDLENFSPRGSLDRISSLGIDQEVCKIGGETLFTMPIAISNLVMTR